MTAAQIAAEVLSVPVGELRAERIKEGLTNESWLVTGAGNAVVVRLSAADERALQLDRISEAQVLPLVEQAGLGAPVLLCAPERRVLVTRFLAGHTLTREAARTPRIAAQLAHLLRRVHAIAAPASVQRISLPAVLQGYWAALDRRNAAQENGARDRARALEIALESSSRDDHCLCHNDVHHLNVINNGERLWLLDWEYAGIGDPFFDLASVACYHAYDSTMRTGLLHAYGANGQAAEQRFERMCWLFDCVKELWLAVRACASQPPDALISSLPSASPPLPPPP